MYVERERWNEWNILGISGKFVVKYLTEIRKLFEEIEKQNKPQVALDLSRTSHLDSSAITLMLNFKKRLLAKEGNLAVYGANDDITGIFSIVGFDNAIKVYTSRAAFERAARS